jgi:hypothetical protein
MVRGGEGVFIGAVHRIAARLDDPCEFVAGALSATPAKARRSGRALGLAALSHNQTGHPMVRQARQMVAEGKLGEIRVVQVEYPQDWWSERLEAKGQKPADWRTDPARSGAGGSVGDIGTQAYNLADFVCGIEVNELCAELDTFIGSTWREGRPRLKFHFTEARPRLAGSPGSLPRSLVP